MEVIPAVDIRGGLLQGDYGKETVFGDDPVAMTQAWVVQGASRIHVVDLDGAKAGWPVQLDVAAKIASAVEVPVQLGGGVRTVEDAVSAISRGVARVVLGTSAVERPGFARGILELVGAEAVVVSVDTRDGMAAVDGWTRESKVSAKDVLARVEEEGVRRVVFTDVSRDGTLTEPNFLSIEEVVDATSMSVIVAGGIASLRHLETLAGLGVDGAIVGTAIYTGNVDFAEAVKALTKAPS